MKAIKNLLTVLVSLIFIITSIELLLRATGNEPRKSNSLHKKQPIIYTKDIDLGWIQKPGKYIFNPWSNEGKSTNFTVNNDSSRNVYYESKSNRKIIFIGGSLTQGWAVDDKNNFVSLFQLKKPKFNVINYGVGGYGGYQSMLVQEKIIKNLSSIDVMVYGFIDHHELRNVAAGSWMSLLNKFSYRGHTSVPFAALDDEKNLIRNPPLDHIKIPYSSYSSLLTKIEKRLMKINSRKRERNKFLISKKIIQKMNENSKKINASFLILFLENSKKKLDTYKDFLEKEEINYIYCPFPDGQSIKGEGHPNKIAHQNVANCLSNNFYLN